MNNQIAFLVLLSFFWLRPSGFSQESAVTALGQNITKLFEDRSVLPIRMQYSQEDLRKAMQDSIYKVSSLS